jgi:hypothetical protein
MNRSDPRLTPTPSHGFSVIVVTAVRNATSRVPSGVASGLS